MASVLEQVAKNVALSWWGKDANDLVLLVKNELLQRTAFTSAYSFSFSIGIGQVIRAIGGDSNDLVICGDDSLTVSLSPPGRGKLEMASLSMHAALDTASTNKRLANLTLTVVHLTAAKALDVWAACWPQAYLNWHLLNQPESYPELESYRMRMLEFAHRSSFLKCPPALLVIEQNAASFAAKSVCHVGQFDGDVVECLDMMDDCGYTMVDP